MTAPAHPKMSQSNVPFPRRRTDELHKGRHPVPGARYFVTFVTQARVPWLRDASCAEAILAALRSWHDERDGVILCATVMPDHVHVLFELGQKLTTGQCVGRWKSEARRAIRYRHDWLRDFYEHHLRVEEAAEDYALDVFLNPYRARLVAAEQVWPYWWTPDMGRFRFSTQLNVDGTPPREWIDWPEDRFDHVAAGE